MEIDRYVIGGAVAVGVLVGIAIYMTVGEEELPKPPPPPQEPNIEAFKRSMIERYKHIESMQISDDIRKEIIKGVHYNIQTDITSMFNAVHHKELNALNEKLYKKHN